MNVWKILWLIFFIKYNYKHIKLAVNIKNLFKTKKIFTKMGVLQWKEVYLDFMAAKSWLFDRKMRASRVFRV